MRTHAECLEAYFLNASSCCRTNSSSSLMVHSCCGVQEGRGVLCFGRKSRLRLPDNFRGRESPKSDESDTSLGESLRFNIKRLASRQNRLTGCGASGGRVGA